MILFIILIFDFIILTYAATKALSTSEAILPRLFHYFALTIAILSILASLIPIHEENKLGNISKNITQDQIELQTVKDNGVKLQLLHKLFYEKVKYNIQLSSIKKDANNIMSFLFWTGFYYKTNKNIMNKKAYILSDSMGVYNEKRNDKKIKRY